MSLSELRFNPSNPRQHDTNLFVLNDALSRVVLLGGRDGGQEIFGGTGAGESLELMSTSHATKGTVNLGNVLIVDSTNSNVNFAGSSPSFQGGERIWFMRNRNTAPTGNPTSGGFLYAAAGALIWRGSAGTITTIAPA